MSSPVKIKKSGLTKWQHISESLGQQELNVTFAQK